MCMEAMLGISVELSLSQASKSAMSFLLSYVFSSTKLEKRAEQVLPGSEGGRGRWWGGKRGEIGQKMYTHRNT
jgi:hypothetical protein